MVVQLHLPSIPAGLVANIVGLLGLAGIAFFAGALLGNFLWTGLIGAVFMVVLSVFALMHASQVSAKVEPTKLRPVTAKAA